MEIIGFINQFLDIHILFGHVEFIILGILVTRGIGIMDIGMVVEIICFQEHL
jgi:hypothetical protein